MENKEFLELAQSVTAGVRKLITQRKQQGFQSVTTHMITNMKIDHLYAVLVKTDQPLVLRAFVSTYVQLLLKDEFDVVIQLNDVIKAYYKAKTPELALNVLEKFKSSFKVVTA